MRTPLPAWACAALAACSSASPADSGPVDDNDTAAPPDDTCPRFVSPAPRSCTLELTVDRDGDGMRPDREVHTYDAAGRLVGVLHQSATDWEGWSRCETVRRADGAPLQEWCIGSTRYLYTTTYDAATGFPVGRAYDGAWDGTVDRVWAYTTDAAGRVVAEGLDQDLDGVADSLVARDFGADGALLAERWDYQADGRVDYARALTWEGGLLRAEAVDGDGDGSTDDTVTRTYDPAGNPLTVVEDEGADGAPEATTTWAYGEDCTPRSAETVDDAGRQSVQRFRWTPEGRPLRQEDDLNDDGLPEQFQEWAWSCPG
jgi:hypothetical protein